MPEKPWHIATEEPPEWLGASAVDVDGLRRWAAKVTIENLWLTEESRTLMGDYLFVNVGEDESMVDALKRLLRDADGRRVAEHEAGRNRSAEAHESLKRFRGRP